MPELTVEEQLARYGAAVEARALDATVLELDPIGADAESDPAHDRRWIPAVAALLVVLALATAGVAAVDDRRTPVATDLGPEPAGPTTHVDSILGWTVEVPDGWYLREFEESCWQGFAVVNHPNLSHTMDSDDCHADPSRWAPASEDVAVVVYRFTGSRRLREGPVPPDTSFPIHVSSGLVGSGDIQVVRGGEWTDLHVAPHVGVEASRQDRDSAQAIVASLRPPTGSVVQERLAPVEIEWWDARVEGASGVVLSFVGGPPDTDPMAACQVRYRADVVETVHEVTIRIHGEQLLEPEVGCTDEGYSRTISIQLEAPLGNRTVRNLRDEVIEVWNHSPLRTPTWLPGGLGAWSLTSEWRHDDGGFAPAAAWGRTWTSAVGHLVDDRCDGSDTWTVSLSQGPRRAVFPGPNQMRPEGIGERSIRGVNAIEGIADSAGMGLMSRSLWWQEGEVAFMISSGRPCDEGEPLSFDELARIAEGLE
jgi:hypothetical protein